MVLRPQEFTGNFLRKDIIQTDPKGMENAKPVGQNTKTDPKSSYREVEETIGVLKNGARPQPRKD